MESEILRCKCGEMIGVDTERGILVGNLILQLLAGKCGTCEEPYILIHKDSRYDIYTKEFYHTVGNNEYTE